MPTDLKPGDKIKDNDPRMTGRILRIEEVSRTHCLARNVHGGALVKIRMNRVYLDEKPRRSGFSIIH